MQIRILGPLEVISQGTSVALGGPKQRALFAALVIERDRPISVERLVDLLWGESAPPTAAKTVHVFVSRLRKALGEQTITTNGSGYRLAVEPKAVDAWRFEQLLQDARREREAGAAKEAARLYREALGQWRGTPLADLVYEPVAQGEIARLEELRVVALEERIDVELELGIADNLVPELEALVRAHPLREHLRAQLMLALYRSGRQADALASYRQARATFADELGLEPGPALRELEQAILDQQPELRPTRRVPLQRQTDRRRGAVMLAFAGLLILGAAAGAAVLLAGGSVRTSLHTVAPDSLAIIDPGRGAVVSDVPIGSGPAAVTIGDGSVWVANAGDQTLARVDPTSNQVVDRVGLSHIPTELAFGLGALWVASATGQSGTVSRVDPAVRSVVAVDTVRAVGGAQAIDPFAPPTPSAVAISSNGVVTNDQHSQLWWRPKTGRARILTLGASHSVDGIAAGAGAVWVASGADDRVLRLDPASGRVQAEIPLAAVPRTRLASPYGITVGDGAVWVTDALANTVSRIDPKLGAVTATVKVGRRPTRLAVGEGAVWVLNAGDGTVSKLDPRDNTVTATVPVGEDVTGIAAGLGGVWVTVGGGPPRARPAPPVGPLTAVDSPGCSSIHEAGGGADVLITSDLPTHNGGAGPNASIADMRAAIRLVLQQHHFRAGRYRIGYQVCDDSRPNEGPDPGLCASNARAYALDARLVGVIGTYNSFCSGIELPTLNAAPAGPVAMISPANTYVGLTQPGPATAADEPERYYPTGARNFVHLPAADDYQSAGIDLFLKQTGHKRLYLLDDGQGTGYAGAIYAREEAARNGITIVGSATWDPNATSYRPLAEKIAHAGADAVLLSGCVCSNGLKLVHDLRSAMGPSAILIGTDNFAYSVGFIHTHGFDGIYLSTAGTPAAALPAAGKRFLEELLPRRPRSDISGTVATAAEATEVLLNAIATSDGTRASIARRLLATRVRDGITGPLSVSGDGNPRPAPITIYRIDSRTPLEPHQPVQGLVVQRVVYPTINGAG